MKKSKLEILDVIARAAFAGFVLVFLSAIFTKPPMPLFVLFFFTAVISEVLYQVLSGIIEAKETKLKKSRFAHLPTGSCAVRDARTNTGIGTLSNENVDFLRKRFLEQGMDDNDFYFLPETLEMFLKEEKPGKELAEFLNQAMMGRNEIELHWDPIKTM